jgi:RsiW-degrading membrane proteinase PrsW (M82 family)
MIEQHRSYDAIDILSLLASLLALILTIAGVIFMLLSTVLYEEVYGDLGIQNNTTSLASLIVMGCVALPTFFLSARALFGSERSLSHRSSRNLLSLILIFPIAVWVGLGVFDNDFPAILGPVAHILGAALPVFFAIGIVRLNGPTLSKRRIWGQFFMGVWATPTIAIIIEVAALGAVFLALIIGLASSPSGRELINTLLSPQFWTSPFDLEPIQMLFEQPWAIALLLMYILLIVPAIEETVKTIAIWPILRRPLTASEAFLSGTLGGAGFALVEALLLTQPGSEWGSTIVARAGATMMHTFTAGLTCWGIAEGIKKRRWRRLLGAFSISTILHGLWNTVAVGIAYATLSAETPRIPSPSIPTSYFTLGGSTLLVVLSLVAFGGLVLFSSHLAGQAEESDASESA